VKRSKSRRGLRPVQVSADGAGVVSHAGVGLLREVADLSGLTEQVSAVLADTYRGPWVHDPGRVFTDLAAAGCDSLKWPRRASLNWPHPRSIGP
jgi:hypothetical protein